MPRRSALHPLAWWLWALCAATAASTTTNPSLLLIILAAVSAVVRFSKKDGDRAKTYRVYVILGIVIVVFRSVLHIVVGEKSGETLLLRLPSVHMPAWAAGITLFGDIYSESLLLAIFDALRLAIMLLAFGAANALVDPKRMLRALPNALRELGTAAVVAVSVAPQLITSAQRVHNARVLRGDTTRGIKAFHRVIAPVLHDTLDRSMMLASSMDARGYGRRTSRSVRERRLTSGVTLIGLFGLCVGQYVLLDRSLGTRWGVALMFLGFACGMLGLAMSGRRVAHSRYRRDRWRNADLLTIVIGIGVACVFLWYATLHPSELAYYAKDISMPLVPSIAATMLLGPLYLQGNLRKGVS